MKKWISTWKEHRKTGYVLAAFFFLSLILLVQSRQETTEGLYVERGAAGTMLEQKSFSYQVEGMEPGEIAVDVTPVQLTEDEIMECLEQAVAEWEDVYLGDNDGPETVRQNLVLPDEFCEGRVHVTYESGDYGWLQNDGQINQKDIPPEGVLVELTAEFNCQDTVRRESRFVQILEPEPESSAWYQWKLGQLIREQEAQDSTADGFVLPTEVENRAVTWQGDQDQTWIFLLLLGVLAAFCLEMKDREALRQQAKKRREQLLYEYPQMVDQLSMLICSGMTIRGAWERILVMDREMSDGREIPRRAYIDEMWFTYRELQSGTGERHAYEQFGQRIGLAPYKRFAALLSQNLMKGTRDLKTLLDQESVEALELRKNQAIRRGEEAGTRLLFPMLIMFVLILLILLVPAVRQFIAV